MNNFLKKYIQLLEYDKLLRECVISLRQQDREKYAELLNYSIKLNEYLHWQQKDNYLTIIRNFVDLKINGK